MKRAEIIIEEADKNSHILSTQKHRIKKAKRNYINLNNKRYAFGLPGISITRPVGEHAITKEEFMLIYDIYKKGYSFGGWYDNEDFKVANRITKIEKGTATDITLYAKWKDSTAPTCTLTASSSSGVTFATRNDNVGVTSFGSKINRSC